MGSVVSVGCLADLFFFRDGRGNANSARRKKQWLALVMPLSRVGAPRACGALSLVRKERHHGSTELSEV